MTDRVPFWSRETISDDAHLEIVCEGRDEHEFLRAFFDAQFPIAGES